MATASQTISDAYEILRINGIGRSPSAAQSAYALRRLNNWLDGLVGFGGSLPFLDVPVDSAYEITTVWPAVRVICQHDSALTVTLPKGSQWRPVQDGFRVGIVDATGAAATNNITLARNGWKIAGSAANATISTNNVSRIYMFRGELGDWKLAADLASGDDLPFPAAFDDPVALILADLIGGRFGQRLSERDTERMKDGEERLRALYCRPPPVDFSSEAANVNGGTGVMGTLSDFLNGVS